uniref:Zinc finger ZZ-type protein n=1 Tax=Fadolivirus 2 TaxID=2740747 RepID=A0A7D3R349_9VIRU|nr:zinc finger ZZ-type protein [Fadolivirus 2]
MLIFQFFSCIILSQTTPTHKYLFLPIIINMTENNFIKIEKPFNDNSNQYNINQITNKIIEFFNNNRDEITNLYKGNLAAFRDIYVTKLNKKIRYIPELNLCFNTDDQLFISHTSDIQYDSNGNIKINTLNGCILANYRGGKFIKCYNNITNNEYTIYKMIASEKNVKCTIRNDDIDYVCNGKNCKNKLNKNGYMCEICDFDLCSSCNALKNIHPHKMFKYIGFIGYTSFDTESIIVHIKIKL